MFCRNKERGEGSCDGLGLETLSPPLNASDRDAIVDIVFVHGLGGKRYHTWTKDGVLWPRDLLAKDFTRARIMTWGYDAKIMKFFGPPGQSNIRDHAKSLNLDPVPPHILILNVVPTVVSLYLDRCLQSNIVRCLLYQQQSYYKGYTCGAGGRKAILHKARTQCPAVDERQP
ncbi:hypothetical protein JMJ35_002244 [Cladonia borealis]|uniref:Uncharacterized protein n=1 Tax=Cladonia borealis TaxID=184061 RepID=A0AA39R6T1_9LECA|nr:hypothetical protein JMJ35_002244 [Cladonia borealis]